MNCVHRAHLEVRKAALTTLALMCVIIAPLAAQTPATSMAHGMAMPAAGPLGISDTRDGSGTSWLPDQSPMYASHLQLGAWTVMLHGNLFVQGITEGGDRGRDQIGSVNWLMAMASRPAAGGRFSVHAMMSLEPLTVGTCGYPDLLQSGESCHGQALHDRQHPHDLFMEIAARYQREINGHLAWDVYGGPVGEPALGPTAFPHRLSALFNPLAPISHHWLDATHISFGVVTAGLYGRRWKAEGSIFNGREPDEHRYDFDFAPLDSYSGRVWFLPDERWALQASAGHLTHGEQLAPGEPAIDVTRVTASATYHRPLGSGRYWASTMAWGRNAEPGEPATNAALFETNADITGRQIVFGRAEFNQKTGADLVLPSLGDTVSALGKLQGGYTYELPRIGPFVPGIGGSIWVSLVPDRLAPFYGGRRLTGAAVFFSLHAREMAAPMSMPMAHR